MRHLIAVWFGLVLALGGLDGHLRAALAQGSPGGDDLAFWEELAFWEAIKESRDVAELESYLDAYPDGRFARLVGVRIKALRREEQAAVASEKPTAGMGEKDDVPRLQARGRDADPILDEETAEDAGGSGGSATRVPGRLFTDCDECPSMVAVPAGVYRQGSDRDRPDERPSHEVDIESGFAIGVYEVTIREWHACVREGGCDDIPGTAADDRLPMSNLNWDDAQQYVGWLGEKTGAEYRLPSESEWEYAARGGESATYWWGDKAGKGNANCMDCGSEWDAESPAPVGSFKPNPFGLYDVHGNLWEWTLDCYNRSYKGAPVDGSAWSKGDCIARVLRGGSWNLDAEYMRVSRRNHYDRDVRYYVHGFRVLRSLP